MGVQGWVSFLARQLFQIYWCDWRQSNFGTCSTACNHPHRRSWHFGWCCHPSESLARRLCRAVDGAAGCRQKFQTGWDIRRGLVMSSRQNCKNPRAYALCHMPVIVSENIFSVTHAGRWSVAAAINTEHSKREIRVIKEKCKWDATIRRIAKNYGWRERFSRIKLRRLLRNGGPGRPNPSHVRPAAGVVT